MAWQVVKREDTFEGSDRPYIAVAFAHFSFNSVFTRLAQISPRHRVTVYVDPTELRVGFEFHKEDRPNSLSLSQASSAIKGEKRGGMFCAAMGIVNRYPWIKSITKLSRKDRRFYDPKKEGEKWSIQLCPAFEQRRARESADILSDAAGIYRYVRENGEVVYIGRGSVKQRLTSPERKDWDFDVIEYSIVSDPDQQIKWEAFWLEKFQRDNERLPIYNRVLGESREKTGGLG